MINTDFSQYSYPVIYRATISKDKQYRYTLSRIWDQDKEMILFIGLNPSTADAKENDPTIRRLIGYATRWGYGGMHVCNLFAYRTPHPKELFKVANPIGPRNDVYIKKLNKLSTTTVLVYGNDGKRLNRHEEILKIIDKPYCIQKSKTGMPMHPLYLKYTDKPIVYSE